MKKRDMDRNLKYNQNEKRINDTYRREKRIEDSTVYGEFIPSEFGWVTPQKQKEKAKEMERITKKKRDK